MPPKYRADHSICGWGSCQATTTDDPLCETHMRAAWARVQARLNAEQRALAGRGDADANLD